MLYGVNFSALSASTYIRRIFERMAIGVGIELEDLQRISEIARIILGVPLFGLDENGVRRTPNTYMASDDPYEQLIDFLDFLDSIANEISSLVDFRHDYKVDTPHL